MNDDRRKAIVQAAITRSRLWNIPVDKSLEISIEKAGVKPTEAEWRILRRDIEQLHADKPGQVEIAI